MFASGETQATGRVVPQGRLGVLPSQLAASFGMCKPQDIHKNGLDKKQAAFPAACSVS
jgi:hypothetical protein